MLLAGTCTRGLLCHTIILGNPSRRVLVPDSQKTFSPLDPRYRALRVRDVPTLTRTIRVRVPEENVVYLAF
jgi:hypothetical protein